MAIAFDRSTSEEIRRRREEWRRAKLAGKALRREALRTPSGFEVQDVYTPADVADLDYERDLGFPGEYPYTRGIDPAMYRGQFWTFGQYGGYGSAEETNVRYKQLIANGATGLSIALDLPTQIGYDSDAPIAEGEVGKVGVAIASLQDMEALTDGVPMTKVRQWRTTANAIGHIMLAMYIVAGEKQGVPASEYSVLIQNDVLKEYISRGTQIYPPRPSLRLCTDVIQYCAEHLPNWVPISVSGYHIREAGATAVQEIAFTFANAQAYIEDCLAKGVDIDAFAPGIWVFFSSGMDMLEEVAKFRAARRVWARMMVEKYGAKNPESSKLHFHTFTAGSQLTAQQPFNNVIRVALQAMTAALGGIQTLHTTAYDEALGLPTDEAVRIALRTQQIVAEESGACNTVDPLGGSYYVEALTNRIEEEAEAEIRHINDMGGAVACIDSGYMQRELARGAWEQQQRVERGEQVVVGVNKYRTDEPSQVKAFRVDPTVGERQAAKLAALRSSRDNTAVVAALDRLRSAAANPSENICPATIEAVRAYATIGEICDALRSVYGEHKDLAII
ncbi:MAG TPA: methylmalonyl-CoA mutase family protein [Chloroflexota bacterium]|nr:methylmalonyl-CoA mutase family protein [Chloroflexota bacterium]